MDLAPRYVNTRGAAQHLACSASFLAKCRCVGGGPRYLKIGKAVRYKVADLDAFAEARPHSSTSEYEDRRLVG